MVSPPHGSPRVAAVLLAVTAALVLSGFPRAQEQSSAPFSTSADLVVLNVSVKDSKGGFVGALGPGAFRVMEDGRPQTLTLFTSEDAPVTIGLVVDSSATIWPVRQDVIAAAAAFAKAGHAGDEFFALAFNENVHPVLPHGAPFTGDPQILQSALTDAIAARGKTALFDAISTGLDYAIRGEHERKVLVAISDGDDNASTATFDDAIAMTRRSNVVIYTVAFVDPLNAGAKPGVLKQFAEASGGEAFAPRSAFQIADSFQRIARDIRHIYTLGYTPDRPFDGGYRALRVDVTSPLGQRLNVRTRSGYLAQQPKAGGSLVVR